MGRRVQLSPLSDAGPMIVMIIAMGMMTPCLVGMVMTIIVAVLQVMLHRAGHRFGPGAEVRMGSRRQDQRQQQCKSSSQRYDGLGIHVMTKLQGLSAKVKPLTDRCPSVRGRFTDIDG